MRVQRKSYRFDGLILWPPWGGCLDPAFAVVALRLADAVE
jgi:hypothetical protein